MVHREVGVHVEEPAALAAVQAAAVEGRVRPKALDAGELLEQVHEPVGVEGVGQRPEGRAPLVGALVRVLALIDVDVGPPRVVRDRGVLLDGGRQEVGRDDVVKDDVGVRRGRPVGGGKFRKVALETVERQRARHGHKRGQASARDDPHLLRYVRSVTVAGFASMLVFLGVLWDFRLHPLRTALGRRDFADFYDIQARALLDGHLNVPRGSLGIEGFIHQGQEFMYFPPGPALLRMPILLVTDAADGKLTAIFMLVAWVATVVLLTMTVWRVRRILRGRAPLPRWEAAGYASFVVAFGAGSVWLYLASSPWVYHEAYSWAIASGLFCTFALLGVIEDPTRRRTLLCGIALLTAVMSRATTGWAFGLAMIATGIWLIMARRGIRGIPLGRLLIVMAVVPLSIGVGINWAKFEHPYEFDLSEQVWTSVNEHRREALEANGGGLVSVDLLPTTLINYFRPNGIRFIPVPPFVTFPEKPAYAYGSGFLDQTYRTGSAVPFMPALVLLAGWGLITVFRLRGPDRASFLRIPVLGAGAVCGAVLVYGYISYRYMAEVIPLFAITGAIGLVDLGHLFMLRSERQRRAFVGVLAGLAAFGVLANTAVAVTTVKLANPGASLDRYLGIQETWSDLVPGDPLRDMTTHSDELPERVPGEHLHIVGDCSALYVSQGDTYWPWVPAEVRALAFTITPEPGEPIEPTSIPLAHLVGGTGGLSFERRVDGLYRLVYESQTEVGVSGWAELDPPGVQVVVQPDVAGNIYVITTHGEPVLLAELSAFDEDWFRQQNLLVANELRDSSLVRDGLRVRPDELPPPERCARLLERLEG